MNKHLSTLVLSAFLFVACSNRNHSEKISTSEPLMLNDSLVQIISIDTVCMAPLQKELILNGRITFNPEEEARIYPMFGGTILSVAIETGDYVKKGDLLATIRSGEIADYEKQAKEAEQQLKIAIRNEKAADDLFHSGMASERDLLQARQELANAEAEQKRIETLYSLYNICSNSTYSIHAPISGFVIHKNATKEMQLRSDQPEELFTISGLDEVWVMADVYESDIPKIEEGNVVRIATLAYKDRLFNGKIDKIYHLLNDESKTMKIRIKLKNENYMLKPGMFTNVYVNAPAEELKPRIPAQAVIFENGKNYTVCISEEGYLKMREIDVYKQNSRYCYLQKGLQEGEKVVNQNALLVYNALK